MKDTKKHILKHKKQFILPATVFAYLLILTLALQWMSGVYASEFGSNPDEAGHYVTGLMVYDYLVGDLGHSPMRFAKDYYDHYPRVALGHWPPGFYLLFVSWALAFSPSRTSAIIFVAFISTILKFVVFLLLRKRFGIYWGIWSATILALLPLIQEFTSSFMADIAVCTLCLWALIVFIRYLEEPRLLFSLLFGAVASAAILTKQSGLLLVIVVGFSMVLSRRVGLMKSWTFWMAGIVVFLVCAPWSLFTYGVTSQAFAYDWGVNYSSRALTIFLKGLLRTFGYGALGVAVVGLASIGYSRFRKPGIVTPFLAVMASLPVSVLVFHSIIPVGIEDRYLIPALPGVIVLTIVGLRVLAKQLSVFLGRRGRLVTAALAVLVAASFLGERFEVPERRFSGFKPIVDQILLECRDPSEHILISSDPRGEGAFVAEVAISDRIRPLHVVERSSKVLATSDWMGRDYKNRFNSEKELLEFLAQSRISWIVVDKTALRSWAPPHRILIEKALSSDGRFFTEFKSFPIRRGVRKFDGTATVYRRLDGP